MKRREFIEKSGMAAAALGLASAAPLACASGRNPSALPWNWTWVHGGRDGNADDWRRRFARVRDAGIEGVLVGGGDPSLLSRAARAEGLEFHRWVWALNRSGDAWVKENHPEWFTVNRNGVSSLLVPPYVGYYQWLCPSRPAVRDYISGVVEETARNPDIDGVHLDYIRHSDVILPVGLWEKYDLIQDREYPEFDFCYCEVCRAQFQAQTGDDPLDLPDPTQSSAWREFRWNSVTGLVKNAADAAHASAKPITAAVFPTPALARKLVRQAWDQWPLDAVFPMLYHEFYEQGLEWIGTAAAEGVAALEPGTRLYAGLYLPSLDPDQLAEAVQIARDVGAAGVSLFEMGGLSDSHLAALSAQLRNRV